MSEQINPVPAEERESSSGLLLSVKSLHEDTTLYAETPEDDADGEDEPIVEDLEQDEPGVDEPIVEDTTGDQLPSQDDDADADG